MKSFYQKKEFFTNKTGKTEVQEKIFINMLSTFLKKKKTVTALFVPVNQIKTSLYFCNI